MRLAALGLLAVVACRNEPGPDVTIVASAGMGPMGPIAIAAPAVARPPLATIREAAHRVLSRRCGECHESHRTTAQPGALVIFDLDQPDWPSRFDAARFAAGLGRFGETPAEDRAAFLAFRDAELAQR